MNDDMTEDQAPEVETDHTEAENEFPSGAAALAEPPAESAQAPNPHAATAYGAVRGFNGADPESSEHGQQDPATESAGQPGPAIDPPPK